MKLSIYSLKKVLFQGEAKLLNCRTAVGEVTILDNHVPLISVLKEGVTRIVDTDEKEYFFQIKSGFLEVKDGNEVRAIVEQ